MHRDLKPANILVRNDLSICLCDFGMSRKLIIPEEMKEDNKEKKKPARKLSRHVSTRWYRAPEIILLEKEYDTKLDVWALGCILQELLYCSKEYRKAIKSIRNRIMFKGKSCYPLTPPKTESSDDFKKD